MVMRSDQEKTFPSAHMRYCWLRRSASGLSDCSLRLARNFLFCYTEYRINVCDIISAHLLIRIFIFDMNTTLKKTLVYLTIILVRHHLKRWLNLRECYRCGEKHVTAYFTDGKKTIQSAICLQCYTSRNMNNLLYIFRARRNIPIMLMPHAKQILLCLVNLSWQVVGSGYHCPGFAAYLMTPLESHFNYIWVLKFPIHILPSIKTNSYKF